MTSPKFIITEGEHGPEYHEGDVKLFFTNAAGKLQATHGNAGRREEVEAWAKRHEAHVPHEDTIPTEYEAEKEAETVKSKTITRAPEKPIVITCPFTGAPSLGDKDPEVIGWWFKNHPEMAEKRYAGRRITRP